MMYSGEHAPLPPNYVVLTPQYGAPPPPYHQQQPYYHQRRVPHYYGSQRSGGGCCLRFISFCYCLLFMLIFLLAAALVLIYTFYQPRIPIYKLEDFSVKTFSIQPADMVLDVEFMVKVLAENPNTRIGFIYGEDSLVTVSFEDSELCRGKVPSFHQGHKNATLVQIPLSGKSSFGLGLQGAFMSQEQQGRIPLLIQVKVPVTIVVNNNIPMRQFVLHVNCHMAVDDLRPDRKPRILSTKYTFSFGK